MVGSKSGRELYELYQIRASLSLAQSIHISGDIDWVMPLPVEIPPKPRQSLHTHALSIRIPPLEEMAIACKLKTYIL